MTDDDERKKLIDALLVDAKLRNIIVEHIEKASKDLDVLKRSSSEYELFCGKMSDWFIKQIRTAYSTGFKDGLQTVWPMEGK